MDFELESHHIDLRDTLRRFFAAEAPPHLIRELDAAEEYPSRILDKFNDLGLWGVGVPAEFGGSQVDQISRCIVTEEMQRAGACLCYAYLPTATFCGPVLAECGTKAQQDELLPRLAAGGLRIAMGLTEPEAGSDLMRLKTLARKDGDQWVIRGQKVFTTGADTADYVLAIVRTDPEQSGSKGMSLLLVPARADGVHIAPLHKLAGQATHTCEVFFDDVRVGADALIGEPGHGARVVFTHLDADRVITAAQSLGTAQGAFDLALNHAKGRVQFGKPIIRHQAVGHMLADMKLRIEAARLLTWRAAMALEGGLKCTQEAAAAKIVASEAATRCASDAMQIFGGYSYILESGIERYYREAKIQEIYSGTNQILRNVLVRELS